MKTFGFHKSQSKCCCSAFDLIDIDKCLKLTLKILFYRFKRRYLDKVKEIEDQEIVKDCGEEHETLKSEGDKVALKLRESNMHLKS